MSYPIGSTVFDRAATAQKQAAAFQKFKTQATQPHSSVKFGATLETDNAPQPVTETEKPQGGIIGFIKNIFKTFSVVYGLLVAGKALWNKIFGHGKKEETPPAEAV